LEEDFHFGVYVAHTIQSYNLIVNLFLEGGEKMKQLKKMTLNINGADRTFICDPGYDTLAGVLRRLGLTGVKVGCGTRQ